MSAIGASIGYLCTCLATVHGLKRDGSVLLRIMATVGCVFSAAFIILQLVPLPFLSGVHFCTQSYIMLVVWVGIGAVFYLKQRKKMCVKSD